MRNYLIKDLMNVNRGSSPRPIMEYLSDSGYRWLKISDFNLYDRYVYETKEFIKEAGLKNTRHLPAGTLILTNSATPGIPIFLGKDMCLHDGFLYFTNINENIININFLYYWFLYNRNLIINQANGSVFKNLKKDIVENFEIKVPDINIQLKIIKILDNINSKIELNNEINNNLHDLAEQQFNEIYLKGSPKKLGELLVNISTGSRPKGGAQDCGVPSIGAEKIEKFGVYNYSSEKYISEEYYEKLKNGKLNSGDVLLYKDGAYTGKVSMCLNDFPHKKAAVNEHVFILNTKNNWAQNYLYFTLYNRDNKEMIHRLACSKAAQPGLNQIELKSVEVNICDEKEIINFENSVKPIMEKISSNTLENKKLVELRDTLLPKLMNGEIDLDNIEI